MLLNNGILRNNHFISRPLKTSKKLSKLIRTKLPSNVRVSSATRTPNIARFSSMNSFHPSITLTDHGGRSCAFAGLPEPPTTGEASGWRGPVFWMSSDSISCRRATVRPKTGHCDSGAIKHETASLTLAPGLAIEVAQPSGAKTKCAWLDLC